MEPVTFYNTFFIGGGTVTKLNGTLVPGGNVNYDF
jgi:hypothetical protein